MTTPTLDTLLCTRPASLTLAHAEACLPEMEIDPQWQAKHVAGTLPEGFEGLCGSMRWVWPGEKLTQEEALWVLAMREHLSWRALSTFMLGDSNQITGMNLEEAARRVLGAEKKQEDGGSVADRSQARPKTYFITRHGGAKQWAEEEGVAVDELIDHLDTEIIGPGDVVIGSLPVNLAAEVCARGGRYLHLSLELPADWRGRELSAEDMRRFGARIEEFRVERKTSEN